MFYQGLFYPASHIFDVKEIADIFLSLVKTRKKNSAMTIKYF